MNKKPTIKPWVPIEREITTEFLKNYRKTEGAELPPDLVEIEEHAREVLHGGTGPS